MPIYLLLTVLVVVIIPPLNAAPYLSPYPSPSPPPMQEKNWQSIAQFSLRDADAFIEYERFLGQARELIEPLLDSSPPNPWDGQAKWSERKHTFATLGKLLRLGWKSRGRLVSFYELFTAPATNLLDRWFESEVVKATLATDAVIGAMVGPKSPGSAYVLLHHVMGEEGGRKGGREGRIQDSKIPCY